MGLENKDRLESGILLSGGYRILEFVGEGSWAYVYKSRHPTLPSMFVAIKQLKPELVQDKDALQQFSREAHIVSQLKHPNVVTIYDLQDNEETNLHYIITEFTEKGTLADLLAQSPQGLPVDQVLHLAMGICSGLEAIHRQGVIHRDIKPSNILLCDVGGRRDIPKVSDFGLAKASAVESTGIPRKSAGIYGSLPYMSPEQLNEGIEIDHRSDLYSLGILLYKLLTGQVPFTGTVDKVFWAHLYMSPKPPRELEPDIPEALEQIVLRSLCKDRKERYQSAADMHEALKAIEDVSLGERRQRKFEDLFRQGTACLEKGEWEAALDAFGQADVLEPSVEQVQAGLREARKQQKLERLYELGVQRLEENNWEEAREYLADVISLDLDYADGQAREQLERATQGLERERIQRDLMVQYRMGMGYFRKQQWELAITELKQVGVQDSEFKDAVDLLTKAEQYMHAQQLFQLAQHHIEREEWEDAVNLLEEIVMLNPPDIDVTRELENARAKWTEARMEQQFLAWYNRGVAQLAAGSLEQAQENLTRIYQRQPGYRDVGDRLKEINEKFYLKQQLKRAHEHEAACEWEQVIDVCRVILAIDPYNREASRCLNRAQRHADGDNGSRPRKIVMAAQDWWDDRERRTKTAWICLFVLIVLALCVVAAQIAGLPVLSFFPTATPTPTPTSAPIISIITSTGIPTLTPTPTFTPTPTSTSMPTSTSTGTSTPTSAPTHTPTPTPTHGPTHGPTNTPVQPIVLVGPEDGAKFSSGQEISFRWTGPTPEPGGYYEVRLDGQSLGQAWFNSSLQQWEQTWKVKQGNHTWQVFLMAPDRYTVRWSGPVRNLYEKPPGEQPDPTPTPAPTPH